MIFTTKHGKQIGRDEIKQVQPVHMNLYASSLKRPIIPKTRAPQISRVAPSDGDRMKWGEPTWTLFHTIPERLSNENFTNRWVWFCWFSGCEILDQLYRSQSFERR